MKSLILVYKTKTGFTPKNVDWIFESITCQAVPFNQINNVDVNNYDIIIYGAGIHAGHIQGLKDFKKKAGIEKDMDKCLWISYQEYIDTPIIID